MQIGSDSRLPRPMEWAFAEFARYPVESLDPAGAAERWQRLLGPPDRDGNCWDLNGGPALRVVEGARDGMRDLTLEVRSLPEARDRLAGQDVVLVDGADGLRITRFGDVSLEIGLVEAG